MFIVSNLAKQFQPSPLIISDIQLQSAFRAKNLLVKKVIAITHKSDSVAESV